MSNSVTNAIGMGLAATAVLLCSNAVISLLRKVIPDSVRIPCYIVVIAGFVTLVEMFIHAFLPELYESLGVFLALITVNCIILGRAEMFAGKNTVGKSILDGIGMGLGFTIALLAMATVREVFGAGTFAGIEIPFMIDHKIEILVKAPGGLMVYGLLIALVNVITKGKAIKKKEFNCAGCPSAGVCNGGCKANEVKEGE
jgi:electron transport complex protein RnfE